MNITNKDGYLCWIDDQPVCHNTFMGDHKRGDKVRYYRGTRLSNGRIKHETFFDEVGLEYRIREIDRMKVNAMLVSTPPTRSE